MLSKKEESLLCALEPRAQEEGIELVSLEVVGSRKAPTIRVYIDTPEGVSFDQLAQAQVWVNELMDALDPFPGAYTLEVSSPGIDRPVRTLSHFQAQLGEKIALTLTAPQNGRAKFTGELKSAADEDHIVLLVDTQEYTFQLQEIKRAHVVGRIDFSK